MCAITGFGILGLLGWGAYTAGKAAWENRSTVARQPLIFTTCLKQLIKQ